jgi:hypothetical protein
MTMVGGTWRAEPITGAFRVVVASRPTQEDCELLRSVARETGPRRGMLLDVSDLPPEHATGPVMRSIADILALAVPDSDAPVAIVGTRSFSWGVARMLESYSDSAGVFARAFPEGESAVAWLRAMAAIQPIVSAPGQGEPELRLPLRHPDAPAGGMHFVDNTHASLTRTAPRLMAYLFSMFAMRSTT